MRGTRAPGPAVRAQCLREHHSARHRPQVQRHQGALTLVTALESFFLLYVSEFTANAPTIGFRALPEGRSEHTVSELPATAGLGGFLITTALLIVTLEWTWQRGRAPHGLLTMLVALTSWLAAAVVDLDLSTTLENEAIATVENEATQTDWIG